MFFIIFYISVIDSFDSAQDIVVDGVTIIGAVNAIYVSSTFRVDIKNNFIDNSYFRGVHLYGSAHASENVAFVHNNLITHNKLDGIDIDSHSARYLVEKNVVIGADNRFLI
ncbi:right-handed parallel beta-helix repeat-containing protein [Catenovulum adriaticum]|uniref:Right-handed parallel beta-helix repeat-containing protein n=1 Tax=Catenovulum adriaticum TaxID=2984846 RepID=A0ABY7AU14_9ALTE|nr:right-handed parallel beta-helix repeat-containing protein [Catenovulum sp. TS8]WAJ72136.1 right-handed parallel beta-helix repeat-containing protein [Catenovulum sp. TS8]